MMISYVSEDNFYPARRRSLEPEDEETASDHVETTSEDSGKSRGSGKSRSRGKSRSFIEVDSSGKSRSRKSVAPRGTLMRNGPNRDDDADGDGKPDAEGDAGLLDLDRLNPTSNLTPNQLREEGRMINVAEKNLAEKGMDWHDALVDDTNAVMEYAVKNARTIRSNGEKDFFTLMYS